MAGPNNKFPFILACGSFVANTGTLVPGPVYGLAAASMARTSKGLYTVTLPQAAAAASVVIKLGTTGANQACSLTSNVNGVLTIAGTDLATPSGADVDVWFEVVQVNNGA